MTDSEKCDQNLGGGSNYDDENCRGHPYKKPKLDGESTAEIESAHTAARDLEIQNADMEPMSLRSKTQLAKKIEIEHGTPEAISSNFEAVNLLAEPSQISTFKMAESIIYGIAPIFRGREWIAPLANIYMVECSGTVIITVDIGAHCYDITSDEDDNCFVSCFIDKCIKTITTQGTVQTLTTTPQSPQGLAFTPDKQHLVVGLYTANNHRENRLVKYSKDGKLLSELLVNRKCRNALGNPDRICINANGNICVSDGRSRNVKFLSSDFKVKNIYQPGTFYPTGTCVDRYGGLLVGNFYNERGVHYVDSQGHLLQILCTSQDASPFALAVDEEGRLWMGFGNGSVKIIKYTQ